MPDYIFENSQDFPEIPIMFVIKSINSLNNDLKQIQLILKIKGNVTHKMLENLHQESLTLQANNNYIINKIRQEINI
jgi:hypothetical protein